MALTIDQLVNKLARIGVIEAAADGAFHDLPYGQGGGGTSNVRMLQATATPSGPPGFSVAQFTYGIPPLQNQPFLSAVVLNPVAGYVYTVTPEGSADMLTATVGVLAQWVGGGEDPGTGTSVNVGLRVEPFVVT